MKDLNNIVCSFAKINLGLSICKKREDGYHDLCSLFIPVGLCDFINFKLSKSNKFNCKIKASGFFGEYIPSDCNNIMHKAAKLISDMYDINFNLNINIKKYIPIGSGLGGGSSNAACVLNFLNTNLDLNILDNDLKTLALKLGADVPFFINTKPALVEGVGEKLTYFEAKKTYELLIVKPSANISTKEIYSDFNLDLTLRNLSVNNFSQIKYLYSCALADENAINFVKNDLEMIAIKKCDKISWAKKYIKKLSPLALMMSGSGSSVFGLFNKAPKINALLETKFFKAGFIEDNFICTTKFVRRT